MTGKFKNFRFSLIFLVISIMLFSMAFANSENPILKTFIFLVLVNITCFTSEYFVIKYYQKYKEKNANKGYTLFALTQLVYTVGIFLVFKLF